MKRFSQNMVRGRHCWRVRWQWWLARCLSSFFGIGPREATNANSPNCVSNTGASIRSRHCPPPPSKSIVKPAAAEIQIGDYGWDARPSSEDGLIHLQGLTPKWQVVWHAGFRPDQIEKVAVKPASQYDYWAPYWAKPPPPPPCPYPVRERNTPTMGLPHHSGRYFENYPSQYYHSRESVPKTD